MEQCTISKHEAIEREMHNREVERSKNYARYLTELTPALDEITYSFTEDQLIDFCTKIATQLVKQGILTLPTKEQQTNPASDE